MQDCSKCFNIVHGEENLGKIFIFCLLFVLEILKMVFTPRKLILMAQNDFVFVISCQILQKSFLREAMFSRVQIPADCAEEPNLVFHELVLFV